jgi:hypothetical protein
MGWEASGKVLGRRAGRCNRRTALVISNNVTLTTTTTYLSIYLSPYPHLHPTPSHSSRSSHLLKGSCESELHSVVVRLSSDTKAICCIGTPSRGGIAGKSGKGGMCNIEKWGVYSIFTPSRSPSRSIGGIPAPGSGRETQIPIDEEWSRKC